MDPKKLTTLSEVMKGLSLTRAEFAQMLDVPKWKLNNWTQLITAPSEDDMKRITEITGYTRDELHLKPLRKRGRPRKGETEEDGVIVMTTDRGRVFTVDKDEKVLW